MAITNRANDPSQARMPLDFSNVVTMTSGETGVLTMIPCPSILNAVQISAFGVQSSPFLSINVQRFIVGSGYTTYILGSTFAPPVFGTSGVPANGVSLPAAGNTLLYLLPGDVLGYQVGGTGGTCSINGFAGMAIIQPTQDIRQNIFVGT